MEYNFGDKRLDRSAEEMVAKLFATGAHAIRRLGSNAAAQRRYYRFLDNKSVTEGAIVSSMSKRCGAAVAGKVVLSIQDTTEINLFSHSGRISYDDSIGLTNAAVNGLGYMLHPSLVIDAQDCFAYGFSHVHLFNRSLTREPKESRNKHEYKKERIEQKESNKWLLSCRQTRESLKEAAMVIIVQDREGDIYEQFATATDERTHLLVRAKSDRVLVDGVKLFSKVADSPLQGCYSIKVEGDKRKGQTKRTAQLEVRFSGVHLKNTSRTATQVPDTLKLYCVEATEANSAKGKGICWRLLTTLPVTTLQEALKVLQWYSYRWMIEEVFRILKKEGFDIESSELERGSAIRKLSLLILDAIIKILQMNTAYQTDQTSQKPAGICFEEEQLDCMELQNRKLQGNTLKQKNPYPRSSLNYATWVIARLGGWKGYASERKPGITTLWIGLEKFYDIFEGYMLFKDVYTR